MKFDKYIPAEQLRPYIRNYIVSEAEEEKEYKVFPSAGLVMGFQYRGELAVLKEHKPARLDAAGITGITDSYRVFKNAANTGTILVYFTETGFARFTSLPVNELFDLSISLEHIFDKAVIKNTEEQLAAAMTDQQRVAIVEQLLLSQLRDIAADQLIDEAVRLIVQSKGTVRIKELNERLFISPSPFEKRFRKQVGTSPKKFASIVRFNALLDDLKQATSLTSLSYEHRFFDQAHFIKDFRQFAGETPDRFKAHL